MVVVGGGSDGDSGVVLVLMGVGVMLVRVVVEEIVVLWF